MRFGERLFRKHPKIDRSDGSGRNRRDFGRTEVAVPSDGYLWGRWHGGIPRPIDAPDYGPFCETASRRRSSPPAPTPDERFATIAITRSPSIQCPLAVRSGRHAGVTAWRSHARAGSRNRIPAFVVVRATLGDSTGPARRGKKGVAARRASRRACGRGARPTRRVADDWPYCSRFRPNSGGTAEADRFPAHRRLQLRGRPVRGDSAARARELLPLQALPASERSRRVS